MELIVINENKIKITMSSDEMSHYGLDENEFHCSITNTREILNKILHKNHRDIAFGRIEESDKLLIQLYPEVSGGCELYVTKIPDLQPDNDFEEAMTMNEYGEDRLLPPKRQAPKVEIKKTVLAYSFSDLSSVRGACVELDSRDFEGESSLYRSDDGRYFLFVTPDEKSSPSTFLAEFGELESASSSSLYLSERGKCLCKTDAVKLILEI
jgi:negative regulator of genetic competence, sporulation and motility